MAKAAPAATLPISAVCNALRTGLMPVKRPLTKPKINSAISVKTIETHKGNAMQKLGINSRIGIVRYAILQDWLHET